MTDLIISESGELRGLTFGSDTEAGLKALADELKGVVVDCTTKEGLKQANAYKRQCSSLRTALEKQRKELKAPLLAAGKMIDGEAKRITAAIKEIEDPIAQQIAAEKARLEAAKIDRVAEAQAVIDRIAAIVGNAAMGTQSDIEQAIDEVDSIDTTQLFELRLEAEKKRQDALNKLGALLRQSMQGITSEVQFNALDVLRQYQAWRRGDDERTLEEIGLTNEQIGLAIDAAIAALQEQQQ